MSNKYIKQLNETNFVFPNYEISEYDVDIVQNINNNSVTGTVATFSAGSISSSSITFTYNWTWNKNNADVFISAANYLHTVSVHMLGPTQTYFKPWRLVFLDRTTSTGLSTYNGSGTFVVTPSQLGLSSFTTGSYYFEIRFIGLKSIYPVCTTLSITVP